MFVILMPRGYVHSFDKAQQIIVACVYMSDAKRWKTEAAAAKWLKRYSDIGYALSGSTAKIVKVPTPGDNKN